MANEDIENTNDNQDKVYKVLKYKQKNYGRDAPINDLGELFKKKI